MADVQIAIIEQGNTEITLAVPGVQGATGATGTVAAAGAGSAAAPSISFAADTNTGAFNPAADTLAISTGGVERLRVNATGTILGSVNAANSTISVPAASGTDINGTPLVLRSGQSVGSGDSAEIRILPSTGSTISGTTVRNLGSSGIYIKQSPVNNNDHPTLGLLQVAIGSSIAQCNYSGLSGESTILTLDGLDTAGQAALEIVGTNAASNSAQGFIRFFGSASKNPYATIVATTPGAEYTSGNLSIRTFNSGIEGTVATFTNTGRLLVGTTTAAATGGILQLSGGITFPATAVASADVNTLDDYEEGTWTPTQGSFDTFTSPTFTATYTKIGRIVHLNLVQTGGTLGWSALDNLAGLPFNPSANAIGYAADNGPSSDNGVILAFTNGNIYFQKANASETSLVFSVTYQV